MNANEKRIEKVAAKIEDLFKTIRNADFNISWDIREEAENKLEAVERVMCFSEYQREADPDNDLYGMDELDELYEKPTDALPRAFFGYHYNPWKEDDDNREPFNPNCEYFTFNGYGNLISVEDRDYFAYWGATLDTESYLRKAEEEGLFKQIAALFN